jgi:hypothetical protein
LRLRRPCNESGGLDVYPSGKPRRFGRRRRPQLWIDSIRDGDDLWADDADWDAATWSMRSELLPYLVRTIRCLCEQLPSGFLFFAGWIGEDEKAAHVTTEQLIELASESNLATHTRYIVNV